MKHPKVFMITKTFRIMMASYMYIRIISYRWPQVKKKKKKQLTFALTYTTEILFINKKNKHPN